MELTAQQLNIAESPLDSSIFLDGPAGTGKSTAAAERLSYLMQSGVPGRTILLFFPQRNLAALYQNLIADFSSRGMSLPVSATYGGLARRFLGLFWPSVVKSFPQFQLDLPPTFLTLESSLYFLSRLVEPLMEKEGYFSTVVVQRNRLFSQILDNLNKSAVHAFPHTEISERLISAWTGDPAQAAIYQQAQQAASLFREYCFQNNLLDYSLQIELFTRSLKEIPLVAKHLLNQFDHLIYDNSEEDIPVAHDFIRMLAPHLQSHLVIYDQDSGYRSFLGAAPESASSLSEICSTREAFTGTFTASAPLQALDIKLGEAINNQSLSPARPAIKPAISLHFQPSYPEMADWIAAKINELLESGVSPGEIAILAPYLSDSLRFLILQSLSKSGIPAASHRPSRALRDEPVTQALLTLAALGHPSWDIYPSTYEIALTLVQTIKGLDLTRAYLLASQAVKNSPSAQVRLADFDAIAQSYQERISFYTGNLYQALLDWLNAYAVEPALPLDHFFTHLFGELLSLPGFGFHNDLSKGRGAAQIIDSVSKFRLSAGVVLDFDHLQAGKEYYRMVKTGVLASQYLKSWTDLPENEVFLSPAYTFLLNNRPVDYQIWLDVGSRGWYERIYQPLTNPYILHRSWPTGRTWNDEEEQRHNLLSLSCITTGLIRRCRKSIVGCLTERDERGFEQKGILIMALSKLLSESPEKTQKLENDHNG